MTDVTDALPGGAMATRPVHFFWIVDASSSMGVSGAMAQVDTAIREALPEMRDVAADNPTASLFVRTLTFADGARWHDPQPIAVEDFVWSGVTPDGLTDFGDALRLVASQLEVPPMPERALPPVLAVVSDGLPTDDWRSGLDELNQSQWGPKAVRLAILIGSGQDPAVLEEFTGNTELVFQVGNAPQLAKAIRWASTVAVKVASDAKRARSDSSPAPAMPTLVLDDDDGDDDDVWV